MDSERGSGGALLDVTDLSIAHYPSPLLSSRSGRPSMNGRLYGEFAWSVQIVQTELSPLRSRRVRGSRCVVRWRTRLALLRNRVSHQNPRSRPHRATFQTVSEGEFSEV